MDIFNGNIQLEENIFNALNWGIYLRDTTKGRLVPFIFLYNEKELVKTIVFQEDEDNYLRAIEILTKSEMVFDQYYIGYEGQMILDDIQIPINTIIVKGIDKRQETGLFIIQKFELNDNFKKIGNPAILDQIPMELEKSVVDNPDFSSSQIGFNILKVKDNDKIKVVGLVRHHCESEISYSIKQFLESNLNNFEQENLSGNFDIDIQYNDKLRKEFLAYIIKDAFYSVINSELVTSQFTSKKIGITLNVTYNKEVLLNETTNDAVDEINELLEIMGNVKKPKIEDTKEKNRTKKWWEFWK
ncbi:MAG TPA: hypothetical protein VK169_14330 [Saprospiraceae bacterium]|nr:hypothetical protein [Saprospiraceae bacterium]